MTIALPITEDLEKISRARMPNCPVVHLSVNEGRSSVFLSQVAKPMSYLARNGLDVSLAMICPFGDFVRPATRAAWAKQAQALDSFEIPWRRLPSLPSRVRRWAPEGFILKSYLRRKLGRKERFLFHCRGTAATQLALELRPHFPELRIISDCRGLDGPEQAEHRGLSSQLTQQELQWKQSLEDRQRRALCGSDAVLCVSEAMKAYLVDTFGLNGERIGVIPCCYDGRYPLRADSDVKDIRRRYDLEGKLVFAHVASETPWQRIDDVVAFCSMLAARAPHAHFLFLTPRPERMFARLKQQGLPQERCTVLSAPHDAVAAHLAAADLGILFRNDSLVSAVASPVKVGEYLAAGLPIIMTPNIGNHSSLVASSGIGLVLPDIEIAPAAADAVLDFLAKNSLERLQARAREVANRVLSWPVYVEEFRSAYSIAECA